MPGIAGMNPDLTSPEAMINRAENTVTPKTQQPQQSNPVKTKATIFATADADSNGIINKQEAGTVNGGSIFTNENILNDGKNQISASYNSASGIVKNDSDMQTKLNEAKNKAEQSINKILDKINNFSLKIGSKTIKNKDGVTGEQKTDAQGKLNQEVEKKVSKAAQDYQAKIDKIIADVKKKK